MKKIGLLMLVLLAGACSMYNYDDFTGTPDYRQEIGENYIKNIVELLIVDNLLAMEKALDYDELSTSISGKIGTSANYQTGGVSIWNSDARWTVNAVDAVKGVQIRKEGADSTWQLVRNADYGFRSGDDPTEYTMTIRMLSGGGGEQHDWSVSLTGKRRERKGYSCKFDTQTPLFFGAGTYDRWQYCKGRLFMEVFRNGSKVDKCCIEYDGGIYDYKFINGL